MYLNRLYKAHCPLKEKLLKFGYPLQSACEGKAVRAGSVCSNDDFNREKKRSNMGAKCSQCHTENKEIQFNANVQNRNI